MLSFIILVIFMMIVAITLIMPDRKIINGGDDVFRASCMYGSDRYPVYANLSSRTWITPIKTAVLIKRIIDDLPLGDERRLLDMTANCGGNLLPFVDDDRYSGAAYEISPDVFDILVQNVSQFSGAASWDLRCSSSTEDRGKYDVIVVDPPFGDEYKTGILYQPRLGDMNMSRLVNTFKDRAKYIVLKLPMVGFDVDGFVDDVGSRDGMTIYSKEDLGMIDGKSHKIMLIVIDTTTR